MDYIFRWIQIRFLSGHQLDLFAGLGPQWQGQTSVPVEGTVSDPQHGLPASAPPPGTAASLPEEAPLPPQRRDPLLYPDTPRQTTTTPRRPSRESLRRHAPSYSAYTQARHPRCRRPRPLPRLRRHEVHVRHGRLPQLRHLRSHHDPKRLLLPLHVLRKHQRLQLTNPPAMDLIII